MKERIEKGDTKDQAFNATAKSANKAFDARLSAIVDEIIADTAHHGFAVYIDKNILPNQFNGLHKQLTDFKEKFEKEGTLVKTLLLVPHCKKPEMSEEEASEKEINLRHPFSLNYLLQSYMRCHLRTDHPTIDPSEDHLKPVAISCFFYEQFKGVEFSKSEDGYICKDRITKNEMRFDNCVEVTFTKESSEFQPPDAFIKAANAVINHKGGFCTDNILLQKFHDCVEFYQSVFNFKEGEFNFEDVDNVLDKINTKGPLKEIISKTIGKNSLSYLL
jgi:hypothetical protein